MPSKKPPTIARGATIQRAMLKRYLLRQRRQHAPSATNPSTPWLLYTKILDWLAKQPVRAKKPGGIGLRKGASVVMLLLLVGLVSACASLSVKERAVVTLNASEIALEGSHDAERLFCSPAADQTQPITHCDSELAQGIGLSDERHQALARLYSRAFSAQILAARALQAWRAGDPAPASLAQYQAIVLDIIAEVTKLWPSVNAVVAKAREAGDSAAKTMEEIR